MMMNHSDGPINQNSGTMYGATGIHIHDREDVMESGGLLNSDNHHFNTGGDNNDSIDHGRNTDEIWEYGMWKHEHRFMDVVPRYRRNWHVWHYGSLWSELSISIRTYMLGSGLLHLGLNYMQAVLCILLGNVVTAVIVCLTSYPAAKYGVSYPLLTRASLGFVGMRLATLLRGMVNVVFFSFESFIGSQCLYTVVAVLWPQVHHWAPLPIIGFNAMHMLCLVTFIAICIAVPAVGGIKYVRALSVVGAPIMALSALLLMTWAIVKVGFWNMLHATYELEKPKPHTTPLLVLFNVTVVIGNWSSMLLNITDFSRYSRSQKDHMLGALLFIPTTMTLFAFSGIAVTGAGYVLFHEPIWSPVLLVSKMDNSLVVIASTSVIAFGIVCSNVTGNLVSAATDLCSLPRNHILSNRMSYFLVGVLGIIIFPWKLFSHPEFYVNVWLVVSSGICASLTAVFLLDYFVKRRMTLNIDRLLFFENARPLVYKAVLAVIISQLPIVPWLLSRVDILQHPLPIVGKLFEHAYRTSYFTCFLMTALGYLLMSLIHRTWKSRYVLVDIQEQFWRTAHHHLHLRMLRRTRLASSAA